MLVYTRDMSTGFTRRQHLCPADKTITSNMKISMTWYLWCDDIIYALSITYRNKKHVWPADIYDLQTPFYDLQTSSMTCRHLWPDDHIWPADSIYYLQISMTCRHHIWPENNSVFDLWITSLTWRYNLLPKGNIHELSKTSYQKQCWKYHLHC